MGGQKRKGDGVVHAALGFLIWLTEGKKMVAETVTQNSHKCSRAFFNLKTETENKNEIQGVLRAGRAVTEGTKFTRPGLIWDSQHTACNLIVSARARSPSRTP